MRSPIERSADTSPISLQEEQHTDRSLSIIQTMLMIGSPSGALRLTQKQCGQNDGSASTPKSLPDIRTRSILRFSLNAALRGNIRAALGRFIV